MKVLTQLAVIVLASQEASESHMRVGGSNQDINKLSSEITTAIGQANKAQMETELKMTQESNAALKNPTIQINTLQQQIAKSQAEVQAWQQTEGQKATSINEAAGEQQSRVVQDHSEAMAAGKAAEDLIDATKRATDEQYNEQVVKDGQQIGEQLAQQAQDVQNEKEEGLEEIEEVDSAIADATEELTETVEEMTEEGEEQHDEQSEVAEELQDNIKEASGEWRSAIKDLSSEQRQASRDIKDAGAEIRNQAQSAKQEISDGVTEREKEFSDWQREMDSNVKSGLRELAAEQKSAQKDYAGELKDLFKESASEQKDMNADEGAYVQESEENKEEASKVMETVTDEGSALAETMDAYKSNAEKRLEQQQDMMDDNIKSVQAELNKNMKDFTSKVESAIYTAQDENYKNAMEQVAGAAKAVGEEVQSQSQNLESADAQITVDSSALSAGAAQVEQSASQASQKLERTLSEVEKNTVSARELAEKLEIDGATAAKTVKEAATEASAEASEAIAKKLEETKQFKDSKIEGVQEAVATASRTLQEQLANLKSQADQGRAAAATTIKQKADIAEDTMKMMDITAKQVAADKEKVDTIYPERKEKAMQEIGKVQVEKTRAYETLETSKSRVDELLNSEVEAGKAEMLKKAQETEAALQDKLQEHAQAVSDQMNSAQNLAKDLTKDSEEDAAEAGNFRDQLRKGIEKSEKFLVTLADGTEAEVSKLTDDANDLSIQEKSEIRAVKRKGEELQDSLSKEVAESFQTQQELADSQQKKVMKKAATGLEIDAKRNVEDLGDVEQGVNTYLKEKDAQLAHLNDQERLLKTDYANMATKSAQMEQELERNMFALKAKQDRVEKDTEAQVKQEHAIIAAAQDSLSANVKTEMANLETKAQAKLNAVVQQENGVLNQVKTAQEMEEEKLKADTTSFVTGAKADQNQIEQDIEGVDVNYGRLQNSVRSTENNLNEEIAKLDNSVQAGFDELSKAEQDGEQAVTKQQEDQIGMMEGEVAALGAEQTKADSEVSTLQEEFNEQTGYAQAAAQNQINQVSQSLNRVVSSAPNLDKTFQDETAETRENLNETLKRIEGSKSRTDSLVADMEGKLDNVRKGREEKAMAIHKQISNMKVDAANRAGQALQKIADMNRASIAAKREMTAELRQFENSLTGMSSVENTHETEDIEKMDSLKDELTRSHDKLMTWMLHNRHRTHAWRHEANKQLANMMASMNMDADEIRNAQVKTEMDLNQELRNMQLKMEDEVSGASVLESKYYGSMIGAQLGKMEQLLGEEMLIDGEKELMTRGADASVEASNGLVDKELQTVDDNEAELEQKSSDLKTNMKNAMQEIQNQLILPKLTASQANQNANAKIEALDSALNTFSGQTGSLLQTGSVETSFSEEDATQAEDAVTRLNAELMKENAKMRAENKKLTDSLEKVKKQYGFV